MSGGEPSSIKRNLVCAADRRLEPFAASESRAEGVRPSVSHCYSIGQKGVTLLCIRPCIGNGGPSGLRTWWVSPTSPRPCGPRWRLGGCPTPTCSPAPGGRERPPAPRFWPRQSTASIPSTATPATSAPPAGALMTAPSWTWWIWTPLQTTAWTRCAPSGTKRCIPPPP